MNSPYTKNQLHKTLYQALRTLDQEVRSSEDLKDSIVDYLADNDEIEEMVNVVIKMSMVFGDPYNSIKSVVLGAIEIGMKMERELAAQDGIVDAPL